MDDKDNDLFLCVTNNDTVIENYIICDEEDVYLSRIGRYDSSLDRLEKIVE